MKKLLFLFFTLLFTYCTATLPVKAAEPPNINARAAVLINADTYEILYAHNPDLQWYPASTTKMMAALLILENCDLNAITTMSYSALNNLPGLYRSLYLVPGNKLSINELLHVLLTVSDNGACNALAEHLDGTQAKFVERMNKRAQELGCTEAHFVTPFGMTDDDHHLSAMDLYRIARECMKHELFRKIVISDNYHLSNSSLDLWLHTCNQIVDRSSANYDSRAKGIKTGYTRDAQCNLVSYAEADGHKLYCVVLGSPRTGYGDLSYPDTKKLLDYGFAKLKKAGE